MHLFAVNMYHLFRTIEEMFRLLIAAQEQESVGGGGEINRMGSWSGDIKGKRLDLSRMALSIMIPEVGCNSFLSLQVFIFPC